MTIKRLIDAISSSSPSEFKDAFEEKMLEKVSTALENEKIRIASSFFQNEQNEVDKAAKEELEQNETKRALQTEIS